MTRQFIVMAFILVVASVRCNRQEHGKSMKINYGQLLTSIRNDSTKRKAVSYLIGNLSKKYSIRQSYLDINGKNVNDFINQYNGNLIPHKLLDSLQAKKTLDTLWDDENIEPKTILNHVEKSLKSYTNSILGFEIPFQHFCEGILPYRVHHELPDSSRDYLETRYRRYLKGKGYNPTDVYQIIQLINVEILGWQRSSPLNAIKGIYDYNGSDVLKYKNFWGCPEITPFRVMVYRCLGIPAQVEIIPVFGKFNNGHEEAVVLYPDGNYYPACTDTTWFKYSIAKMYRETYLPQPNQKDIIKSKGEEEHNIPIYFDCDNRFEVTALRTKTSDLTLPIADTSLGKVYYLSVYYKGSWTPVEWSSPSTNKKEIVFKQMGRKILYNLTAIKNRKNIYPSDPVIVDTLGEIRRINAKNNDLQRLTVTSYNRNSATIDRNTNYHLFYWETHKSKWTYLASNKSLNTNQIVFSSIPKDGLYHLSDNRYQVNPQWRPFTYEQEKQIWW